jgi:hypothetical protein
MRTITLEDHFATPMFQERFPQGNVPGHFLADRGRYLGYDISAEWCLRPLGHLFAECNREPSAPR